MYRKKGIQKIPGKPIGDEKTPFTNRISLRKKNSILSKKEKIKIHKKKPPKI